MNEKLKQAKIFICLIGICPNLLPNSMKALETINSTLRGKSSNFIVVNPPDNFSTTDGNKFSKQTKTDFYNMLNSFLA